MHYAAYIHIYPLLIMTMIALQPCFARARCIICIMCNESNHAPRDGRDPDCMRASQRDGGGAGCTAEPGAVAEPTLASLLFRARRNK